jgi:hypothetical protein
MGKFGEPLHRWLHAFNETRHRPSFATSQWQAALEHEVAVRAAEIQFVEGERAQAQSWAREAPRDPARFAAWFEGLATAGPGQGDPLFPWLAHEASLADMRWFLWQETAGEAGFDDLVALTQLQLPARAKLELARNYWDEMGRGRESAMHGPMLARLGEELDLDALAAEREPVWETLALANLMVALASNRQYAYHSIGALGVIELTAPGRAALVNAGLQRLGIRGEARRYFALHATLDVKHSLAWNREVIVPLVEDDPRAAAAIAEGALMRLAAGARCFARYKRELWGEPRRDAQGSAAHRPTTAILSTCA